MAVIARIFRSHGTFCAEYPCEVIVATSTLTALLMTSTTYVQQSSDISETRDDFMVDNDRVIGDAQEKGHQQQDAAVVTILTILRVFAVLYSCYQFRHLYCKLKDSKHVLVIAGLFTVFSSLIFTTTVLNYLWLDVGELKDALFFFLLLTDLGKTALLAEFALSAGSRAEVRERIGKGMAVLGPSITLDTAVETLVIGVGTLSGVYRLEMLSYIACLSVAVNYIVFMTFYPACLSLITELSKKKLLCDKSKKDATTKISHILLEQDQKSNPVVQRVKLIMSVGLTLVHIHSWWPLRDDNNNFSFVKFLLKSDETTIHAQMLKYMTLSADHLVILILLLALIAKFFFYEKFYEFGHLETRNASSTNQNRTVQIISNISPIKSIENTPPKKILYHKSIQTDSIQTNTFNQQKISTKSDEFELNNKPKDVFFPNDFNSKLSTNLLSDEIFPQQNFDVDDVFEKEPRSIRECLEVFDVDGSMNDLTDEEVLTLVKDGQLNAYQLETVMEDLERAVRVRRKIIGEKVIMDLPYAHYDYARVRGACCENVIGYVPIPVGIAGPLTIDGTKHYVPMATTEGCLVASTNRGCRALADSQGVKSKIVADGMTRGPVVRLPNLTRASELMQWLDQSNNLSTVRAHFEANSRFVRLIKIQTRIAGRHLFLRFVASTGDAMGMNMLSKATEQALKYINREWPDVEVLSLSGNFCADKKSAAINWIEGRGKSVVCEAIIPSATVLTILKTSVHRLVDVNISKNLVGSAMAGCTAGGYNAHAANVVTAIFIATGQDPAQTVTSSSCLTLMEPWGDHGQDLYISCTMPSIEIGTIGGGTILAPQAACLEMLGIRGPNLSQPGENAKQLARIICATVLAGELSLMAALSAGHLVRSHLKHNRSTSSTSQTPSTSIDGI